jgi:Fe-S cluster biogenesis protein NfuA
MTERTNEEIVSVIKELIEEQVKPAVAGHGGNIEYVSYDQGHLVLELGGACSGCAGSTMTLKMGVENMLKHFVPEVQTVEAVDDPFSTVDPYYMPDAWDLIDIEDQD